MNNKLRHDLMIGNDIFLKDICISHYEINSESCKLYTERGDEISLDISKFNNFSFDAAPYEPTNSIEMTKYLRNLEEDIPYNAYLKTADGIFLSGFYRIGKDRVKMY